MTSRFYETEQDLQQMQDLLMEARLHTGDWRYAHIGDLLFWFFMVACHLNPEEHIRLWHAGDRLVGYAILYESVGFRIVNKYLEYVKFRFHRQPRD